MRLILKPPGRGNWTPLVIDYTGPRLLPLVVHVGMTIVLAGVTFRVCEVQP